MFAALCENIINSNLFMAMWMYGGVMDSDLEGEPFEFQSISFYSLSRKYN